MAVRKRIHEIRDPIHVFIRLDSDERKVLDSRAFQRLRHIHQLGLTHLVYPGATHRRFEHSLGVMELASRVYDVVTDPRNITQNSVKNIVPGLRSKKYRYWRQVLRMAALCHDIGHLPFSHAAEKDLLRDGWDHERLTVDIILKDSELNEFWEEMEVDPVHVAKLAVGPEKYPKSYERSSFDDWEAMLSEIIVGNSFGVDRMDYLLRDSYHAGVPYGKFDHYRLIDTLRILPKAEDDSSEPCLGIDKGGIHCAEALLLARYFMFTQLYFHDVRRIYDIHLKDFLKKWLSDEYYFTKYDDLLRITDNEVTVGLLKAAEDTQHPAHEPARCIVKRKHFRLLYTRDAEDVKKNTEPGEAIYEAAVGKFGEESVRYDSYKETRRSLSFPVLTESGRIEPSLTVSSVLNNVPIVMVDYVFISPDKKKQAEDWLKENRETIIAQREEDEQ